MSYTVRLTAAAPGTASPFQSWGLIIFLAIALFGIYFLTIRPQRKQEKETQKMRANLAVGDEIVTIGGVVGIIISISEETITIISSRDRTRIQFLKSAVSRVQVSAAEEAEKKDAQSKD